MIHLASRFIFPSFLPFSFLFRFPPQVPGTPENRRRKSPSHSELYLPSVRLPVRRDNDANFAVAVRNRVLLDRGARRNRAVR